MENIFFSIEYYWMIERIELMGFPIPGDVIEQSLDLNQRVIKNAAATFFMRVEGTHQINVDVQLGDLLVVDRSLDARDNALVVAALNGELIPGAMTRFSLRYGVW